VVIIITIAAHLFVTISFADRAIGFKMFVAPPWRLLLYFKVTACFPWRFVIQVIPVMGKRYT
jgi:hypothetical protein